MRLLLLGGIFGLFGKRVNAGKKDEDSDGMKEAMFWRRLDD